TSSLCDPLLFSSTAPPPTHLYPLSLHDALPISSASTIIGTDKQGALTVYSLDGQVVQTITGSGYNNVDVRGNLVAATNLTNNSRSEEHTSELQSRGHLVCRLLLEKKKKKL